MEYVEAERLPRLSVKEYLELEQTRGDKLEYVDGFIYNLAGGTLHHGMICGNVFGELRNSLKKAGQDCHALSSEVKLHIRSKNSFLYPDAMVICGELERSQLDPESVTNPMIVVEVFSKTTAEYDRGDKFYLYRQIASLQEYILIEQARPLVEVYKRQGNLWKITRVEGLEASLVLQSIGLELELRDIYVDIDFA